MCLLNYSEKFGMFAIEKILNFGMGWGDSDKIKESLRLAFIQVGYCTNDSGII